MDLYLIHRPNSKVPIEETMNAMAYLVDNKLVRNIGVSFFNIEQLKEAQKYSKYPIVTNQLKFSLWLKSDLETIKYCQDNDIIVTAYKIFGRGKIKTEKIPLIEELAKKYNKSEAQIILNWVVNKKNMVALFKSTNKEHMKENLDVDFEMSEYNEIDALVRKI